jgi:hypothetical protein
MSVGQPYGGAQVADGGSGAQLVQAAPLGQ